VSMTESLCYYCRHGELKVFEGKDYYICYKYKPAKLVEPQTKCPFFEEAEDWAEYIDEELEDEYEDGEYDYEDDDECDWLCQAEEDEYDEENLISEPEDYSWLNDP